MARPVKNMRALYCDCYDYQQAREALMIRREEVKATAPEDGREEERRACYAEETQLKRKYREITRERIDVMRQELLTKEAALLRMKSEIKTLEAAVEDFIEYPTTDKDSRMAAVYAKKTGKTPKTMRRRRPFRTEGDFYQRVCGLSEETVKELRQAVDG